MARKRKSSRQLTHGKPSEEMLPEGIALERSLPTPKGLFTVVVWSPDGESLAAGNDDGYVMLYDLFRRKTARDFVGLGELETIYALAWAPDGSHL